jgi:hypothetical protein
MDVDLEMEASARRVRELLRNQSCGVILVDQPAKDLPAADARDRCWLVQCLSLRRLQFEASVGSVLVVMTHVTVEHSSKMPLIHDEETVGALGSHCSQPALGDGVRIGARTGLRTTFAPSPCHTASNPGTKLPVAVTEQVLDDEASPAQLLGHVASAQGDPFPVWVGRDASKEDSLGAVMDEEEHVGAA